MKFTRRQNLYPNQIRCDAGSELFSLCELLVSCCSGMDDERLRITCKWQITVVSVVWVKMCALIVNTTHQHSPDYWLASSCPPTYLQSQHRPWLRSLTRHHRHLASAVYWQVHAMHATSNRDMRPTKPWGASQAIEPMQAHYPSASVPWDWESRDLGVKGTLQTDSERDLDHAGSQCELWWRMRRCQKFRCIWGHDSLR